MDEKEKMAMFKKNSDANKEVFENMSAKSNLAKRIEKQVNEGLNAEIGRENKQKEQ